jgi:DNA-binding transcriptional regulator PaaX
MIADNVRTLLADGPLSFYWIAQRYPIRFHADGSFHPTTNCLRATVCLMNKRGQIVREGAPKRGVYRLP